MTGHSHQAWPDIALDGQKQAYLDAAELLDKKWNRVFEKYERVCRGYAEIMNDDSGDYVLGANTHELLVRFLSALDLKKRPSIVTTDGEFHSARRQLARLEEIGFEVIRIPSHPSDSLAERLAKHVNSKVCAVIVSSVFFETSEVVTNYSALVDACEKEGSQLFVDAYHSLNVVPFSIPALNLKNAFIVGGGYKYMQLGEGVCFLRIPKNTQLKPVITGWFAEFEKLHTKSPNDSVFYGSGPTRFYGSTFDPTSVYRASKVLDYFKEKGLSASLLHKVNAWQIQFLMNEFGKLGLDKKIIDYDHALHANRRGGFLSFRTNSAAEICESLDHSGVAADFRGQYLRFGPAPYLNPEQLKLAVQQLGNIINSPKIRR